MAVLTSAAITDSLAFSYDSANTKSYAGPPIQNLTTSISPQTFSGAGYSFVGGSEVVDIPELGPTRVQFCNAQNNYAAVSNQCCPSIMGFGGGFAVSPSTLYTYAIVYKCESGYTHPNFMYRYEYNGGTYVTEGGVHSDANRISLGDGWFWAWGTFTTQATTNNINSISTFYYRYSTIPDKYSVAKILLVQGNFTNLHPKHWPDTATTRAAVNAIKDLTGRATFTPTSLDYTTNRGKISFTQASSSTLVSSLPVSTIPALGNWSLETWMRVDAWPSAGTQRAGVILGATNYCGGALYWNGTAGGNGMSVFGYVRGIDAYRFTPTYTIPSLSTYNHFVVVNNFASGFIQLYLNGSLFGQAACATAEYDPALTSGAGNIGLCKAQVDGGGTLLYSTPPVTVDIARVYTKALSASEVSRNFNTSRGRFGV
jgi:hypothetical protein